MRACVWGYVNLHCIRMKEFPRPRLVWLLFVAATSAQAAILTTVPMGGSMVHVSFAYDAVAGRVEAVVDPIVPQMTPLDASNPADNFFSGDPWFALLDPSQQGLALNRQYGFVMDAQTDPLPQDVGIWIRKTYSTPDLGLYRYRSTDPKAWEPIFGAAGSTNLWQWNLSMFHPAPAAPPTNGTHSASFEAFAVNLISGEPVPGIGPATFTLNWTIVSSGRPILCIGCDGLLRWPATATNYALECAESPAALTWTSVTNTPLVQGGQCTRPFDPSVCSRFYRLRRVP